MIAALPSTALPTAALPYAALLTALYVALAARVIRLRGARKVALGTGEDTELERAVRVHANFAEYVPLALVLMALFQLGGGPAWVIHLAGVSLLAGRASHAWGVSQPKEDFRWRIGGMALTFGVLGTLALASLGLWVVRVL